MDYRGQMDNRKATALGPRRTEVLVTNRGRSALLVRVEPWGREYPLPAGGSHGLVFTGPDSAEIEVEIAPTEVTVHGWVGSVLDGEGLPVPEVPPGFRV